MSGFDRRSVRSRRTARRRRRAARRRPVRRGQRLEDDEQRQAHGLTDQGFVLRVDWSVSRWAAADYQPEARPGKLGAPRGPVKPFALIAGTLAARPGLAALGRSRSCRKSSFYSIIPPCPRKAPARAPPPAERHARHGDHIEPKSLGSRVQASTAQSRSPPRRGIEDSKGRIALD